MIQSDCYEYFLNNNSELLICVDDKEAFSLSQCLEFLDKKTFVMPDFRAYKGEDLRSFSEEVQKLFAVLNDYYKEESSNKILISPIRTLLHKLPSEELFKSFNISFAQTLDLDELKNTLKNWGYNFVDVVETKGEVSFRGDIIDIFCINKNLPYRISLFDNEIEGIREFEPDTQRSQKNELETIEIPPVFFALNDDEYNKITKNIEKFSSNIFQKDMDSLALWAIDFKTKDFLKDFKTIASSSVKSEISEILQVNDSIKENDIKLEFLPDAKFYKDAQIIDIKSFIELNQNKKIKILARNEALLKQAGLELSEQFTFIQSPLVLNLTSKDEAIISLNKAEKRKQKRKASILLDELKIGDYVVHEEYGVGIFKGLEKAKIMGALRDFVCIHYQGDDKLLLPVENLSLIDRYIADSGVIAVLDKLGKGSFQKLKAKAKAKLFEIASAIVEMAAKRQLIIGYKIKSDFEVLSKLRENAGFVYTKDQENAVEAIFKDFSSGQVMDRLISGDVGFGKTEVAINAILATVKSGFQALFVAPTTLLSAQHYKNLLSRLFEFDVKVARLDRFCSTKEKKSTLEGLKNGNIDVCIGTHALLGVECKNLALLIIDEEHKFGVKQKEKLKNMRENIHVLSMSATPIPRSLNMALSSIKSYSTLLTPPQDRENVRTFVKNYDEKLIKEVVLRELRRNGQIFYIYNRIASIELRAKKLKEILPNLRILILHSQISSKESEEQMLEFENGKYDVLLCTSIVESGIHLPNVNTIIVESADKFGMADLHQLRGRVGRGKRQGFCYYLVDKENLSDNAKKRLIALESNSFLGSGSILAYHDLEIRGGGNLLGTDQSGHIKQIGYSLYLKMLEDQINILLNNQKINEKQVEVKLAVSAYLSDELVGEDRVRLELYRRLSKCKSVFEVYEIESEIQDRFGKIDTATKQFLDLIVIKILASEKNIKLISNYQQMITLMKENEEKIILKSKTKDDDDIIAEVLSYLRKK